ncbi:MAG: 2Fe-2S iron-sulfur cluster-binding protein [Chloroflexota bacterium]
MASITIDDKTFEAPDGKRLILALIDEGIDMLHRCGGNARCTTCRVTFSEGEPEAYHPREQTKLENNGAMGQYRLSCHILCEGHMAVEAPNRFSTSGLSDPGPRPDDEIPA